MIVTLKTECIRTVGQVAAFVEASGPVDFQHVDRAGAREFVARMLSRLATWVVLHREVDPNRRTTRQQK